MDGFMNPRRNQASQLSARDKENWGFIENALIARHAPECGPSPLKIKCPSCSRQITSYIETETYSKTHFCAAAMIMTIVCCPMFWLPYAVDTWKKKHHYCPSCRMYLGTYMG